MFLVVKELVGLPGVPTTEKGIRQSVNKRAAGAPELVRKRATATAS